jgi:hypothetical protein
MRVFSRVLVAAVAALGLHGVDASCDTEKLCDVTFHNNGGSYSFDFHNACKKDGDYSISDGVGHTYTAQICGTSAFSCLPAGYLNTYQYGVAVQSWGSVPPQTSKNCVDKATNQPAYCSADCQVLGVGNPEYSLIDPSNPSTGGVRVSFKSARTNPDDPFYCPWNPSTMSEDPRVVHYFLECDTDYADEAFLYRAVQNSTDDCSYKLYFKTAYACANYGIGLAGGWIFLIILFVSLVVYAVAFGYLQYRRTGKIEWPHQDQWVNFFALVRDGAVFVFCCGKKPSSFAMGVSRFSGVGPKDGSSSSSTTFTGSSPIYKGTGGAGYQTSAGTSVAASSPAPVAGGKAATSAYSEL